MNYGETKLSISPYKVHNEFRLILEDMVSNTPNPERPRPVVAWRQSYNDLAKQDSNTLPEKDQHFIDSK